MTVRTRAAICPSEESMVAEREEEEPGSPPARVTFSDTQILLRSARHAQARAL